jgi:hypothetical protein
MKLDKNPFLTNMNMVKLNGKKMLVQPSQTESTNGKEVIILEERPPRMIKPKSSNDGQGRRMMVASCSDAQRPPFTSTWPNTLKAGSTSWGMKFRRPRSSSTQFRRPESSSTQLSSSALLPHRATNVWAMGASVDDVSTLPSLDGVVRTMGSATNALPSRMDRTF